MEFIKNNKKSRRIRALLTLLLGLLVLVWSEITFDVLIIAFGLFAIFDGIFVFFNSNNDKSEYLEGVAYVFLGICVLAWPDLSEMLLLAIIIARMLMIGFFELFYWDEGGLGWSDGGLSWFSGIINLGFGLYLIFGSYIGLWSMLQYIGLYWVIMGFVHYLQADKKKPRKA